MKFIKTICTLGMCLSLLGCASIVGSTSETITINSNAENALVTIKNKQNVTVFKGSLPTSVTLKKKSGFFSGERYSISSEKNGYLPYTRTVDTTISGWYFGNILFGGLIGLLIVDPATGAMWSFDEENIFIPMEKK